MISNILTSGKKGFTLLEILITAALMLLFFYMVFAFLLPGMRIYALGSTRAEMEQEAVRVIDKIVIDLSRAVPSGVSLYVPATDPQNGPVYLGIMRLDTVTPQGKQQWENNLIVYSWASPGSPLVRKEWTAVSPPNLTPSPTFASAERFSQNDLASIANEPALKGKVLARDVSKFLVTCNQSATSLGPPFVADIELTRVAATGRPAPEVFRMTRSIGLRNQL